MEDEAGTIENICAELSNLIYSLTPAHEGSMVQVDGADSHLEKVFVMKNIQGGLFSTSTTVFMVFRGTSSKDDWTSTNLRVLKVPFFDVANGEVHTGFHDGYFGGDIRKEGNLVGFGVSIHDQLVAHLKNFPLSSSISVCTGIGSSNPSKHHAHPLFARQRIVFTGHSLGGALASMSLAAMTTLPDLARELTGRRLSLVTFGAPKIGCARFARHVADRGRRYDLDVRRFVVESKKGEPDFVTTVPPGSVHICDAVALKTQLSGDLLQLGLHPMAVYKREVARLFDRHEAVSIVRGLPTLGEVAKRAARIRAGPPRLQPAETAVIPLTVTADTPSLMANSGTPTGVAPEFSSSSGDVYSSATTPLSAASAEPFTFPDAAAVVLTASEPLSLYGDLFKELESMGDS